MKIPPYCDYCGETIHNWHKIKRGRDIDLAINARILLSTVDTFKNKILGWIITFGMLPLLSVDRGLCFCNRNHKDKFAKRIGLKIKCYTQNNR